MIILEDIIYKYRIYTIWHKSPPPNIKKKQYFFTFAFIFSTCVVAMRSGAINESGCDNEHGTSTFNVYLFI